MGGIFLLVGGLGGDGEYREVFGGRAGWMVG